MKNIRQTAIVRLPSMHQTVAFGATMSRTDYCFCLTMIREAITFHFVRKSPLCLHVPLRSTRIGRRENGTRTHTHTYVCARASMFSGEVNAPINYPLNVPLNATSLDFRANLFVRVELLGWSMYQSAFVANNLGE